MPLILVEVSVKVACRSTTATDCSHRAISMLLILVEVSVKVACQSTTAIDCSHVHGTYSGGSICESGFSVHYINRLQPQSYIHDTSMILILVEVSVKVACWSTTSTDCNHRANSMLLILVEVSVKVTCQSTTATDCSHRARRRHRHSVCMWQSNSPIYLVYHRMPTHTATSKFTV